MVYIAKDTVECLSPGAILGDSKSVETRRLPIEIGTNGQPVDTWNPGYVAYVDEDGYARPFVIGETASYGKIPYGVVAEVNRMPAGTVYTNSEVYNTVLLVVSGVVGVEYREGVGGQIPAVGDLVNQYGGKYNPQISTDVCVGVCDGVATAPDGETSTPAVRVSVLRFGEAADAVYPVNPTPVKRFTRAYFRNATAKGTPITYDGTYSNPDANDEEYPIAVMLSGQQNLRFEGYATESYEAGAIGDVQISGEIELPYFIPDTSSNVIEKHRIVRLGNEPNWSREWFVQIAGVIASVGEFCALAFGAISKGSQMIKTIKGYRGSSTGRLVNKRPEGQLGWVIDPKTNKAVGDDPEPVITGWVTIDINPQNDFSPASLEMGKVPYSINPYIGHVYGGTDAQVKELTDNFTGIPFFGVCISDELDSQNRAAFAREGAVNVLAASAWHAGDYIDYMRAPIPEAYEPYIARIGIALTDCDAGEMGAVELNPYDPNEYIILDHVNLVEVTQQSLDTAVYQVGKNIYVCSQVPPELYPDGNYISMLGILRHYINNYVSDPEGNTDRAIIQVGGYAWTQSTAELRNRIGCPVRSLGKDWMDVVNHGKVGEDTGFMQLGTVVSTFSDVDSVTNTLVVRLDIRHHPRLAPPEPVLTGREDVRLDIKKVIPLIKTANNTMAFADPNDQYFTLEGVADGVYNDEVWREEFITHLVLGYITQSAKNLTLNGATYSIVSEFAFASTTGNRLKINLNSAVPDQWDDPDKQVVGYLIYAFGADTAFKYLLTPLHFIMDSTNARKPTEPTDESTKTNEEVTNNA